MCAEWLRLKVSSHLLLSRSLFLLLFFFLYKTVCGIDEEYICFLTHVWAGADGKLGHDVLDVLFGV